MGDPKFSRRKYSRPSHPWEATRIKSENEFFKKYGLKNKRELWKAESLLRDFRKRARELQARVRFGDQQAERERGEILAKLQQLGILATETPTLDDVLGLTVDAVLQRRLQTMAYLKGLARSVGQARQFIVHGHASIRGRRVTIPGYLVKRSEEDQLAYHEYSPISNELHPARPEKKLTEMDVPVPSVPEPPTALSAPEGGA